MRIKHRPRLQDCYSYVRLTCVRRDGNVLIRKISGGKADTVGDAEYRNPEDIRDFQIPRQFQCDGLIARRLKKITVKSTAATINCSVNV